MDRLKQVLKYVVFELLLFAGSPPLSVHANCNDENLPYKVAFINSSMPVFNCMSPKCSSKIDLMAVRCLINWQKIHCIQHHKANPLKKKSLDKPNCFQHWHQQTSTLMRRGMLGSGGVWRGGYVLSNGRISAFDFITDLRKRVDAGNEAIYEITVHRVKCSLPTRYMRAIKSGNFQNQRQTALQKPRTLRPVVDKGRFFHRRFLFWKEVDRKASQRNKRKNSAANFRKSAKVAKNKFRDNFNLISQPTTFPKFVPSNTTNGDTLPMKSRRRLFAVSKGSFGNDYSTPTDRTLQRIRIPFKTAITVADSGQQNPFKKNEFGEFQTPVLPQNSSPHRLLSKVFLNRAMSTYSLHSNSTLSSCEGDVKFNPTTLFEQSYSSSRPVKMVPRGAGVHPIRSVHIFGHRFPRPVRNKIVPLKKGS